MCFSVIRLSREFNVQYFNQHAVHSRFNHATHIVHFKKLFKYLTESVAVM